MSITWPACGGTGGGGTGGGGSVSSMVVGVNAEDWGGYPGVGGKSMGQDIATLTPNIRWDDEASGSDLNNYYLSQGLKASLLINQYNGGGVSAMNASSYASGAVSTYQANCPQGVAQCPVRRGAERAVRHLVQRLERGKHRQRRRVRHDGGGHLQRLPLQVRTQQPEDPGVHLPGVLKRISGRLLQRLDERRDERGAEHRQLLRRRHRPCLRRRLGLLRSLSAQGNRNAVTSAHQATGKPVYVTEVGWPTDTGGSATGDSEQWTEAQQATNIYNFVNWARGTGYVGGVWYYAYMDDAGPAGTG